MKDRNIHKVVVLDMQPIDPPTGGGRLRLLGLYHGLGESFPTAYIGIYDWPGEKFRKHRLSKILEEINIPLSKEHFSRCNEWQIRAGGKTIIDTAFHQLAHLEPEILLIDEVLSVGDIDFQKKCLDKMMGLKLPAASYREPACRFTCLWHAGRS